MIDQDNSRIHLVIPSEFLAEVDRAAIKEMMSRSDFIRVALMEKLGRNQLIEQKRDDFFASLTKYDKKDRD